MSALHASHARVVLSSRFDPRARVALTLALLVCIVLESHAAFSLSLGLAGFVTTLALRLPLRDLAHRLLPALAFALVLLAVHLFAGGQTPMWRLALGSVELVATHEGAARGLLVASRIVAAVFVTSLLVWTTPPTELLRVLRWARVPTLWIDLATLMVRYLFVFLDTAARLRDAQRLRLGYAGRGVGGLRRSIRSLAELIGALLLRSIDQATRTHEAMMLRGAAVALPARPWPLRPHEAAQLLFAIALPLVLVLGVSRLGMR